MEQPLFHFREFGQIAGHIVVSAGTQGPIKGASEALSGKRLEQGAFQFGSTLTDMFEGTGVGSPSSILTPSGTGSNGLGDFLARLFNQIDQHAAS
jgi:hypothetical protein